MAKLRAYQPIDMLDSGTSVGDVVYSDSELLVVAGLGGESYYYGDFSYPNGAWKGAIEVLQVYDSSGDIVYDLRGMEVSTKVASARYSTEKAVKKIFAAADDIRGSAFNDRLVGFEGDDEIAGNAGADFLQGREGADILSGGKDDDKLSGGDGRDALIGGRGRDLLFGGEKADVVVFARNTQADVIADFGDGKDRILIESAAEAFRDLEISASDDDVLIAYADAEITLRDYDLADLGKSDFILL